MSFSGEPQTLIDFRAGFAILAKANLLLFEKVSSMDKTLAEIQAELTEVLGLLQQLLPVHEALILHRAATSPDKLAQAHTDITQIKATVQAQVTAATAAMGTPPA